MGALIVLQLRAKQNPWQSGIGGLVAINLVLTFADPRDLDRRSRRWSASPVPQRVRCCSRCGGRRRVPRCAPSSWWASGVTFLVAAVAAATTFSPTPLF